MARAKVGEITVISITRAIWKPVERGMAFAKVLFHHPLEVDPPVIQTIV
jgi:hypothetical protein|tara:strand:- start:37 stop:183 length:147 start_codon:yes stop_codon:yes gene_type:complete